MPLLAKMGREALQGIVPGSVAGAGIGALAAQGKQPYQQADSAAMGMGIGALGGMAAKPLVMMLFRALKAKAPQADDMQLWAMAQRQAHEAEMTSQGVRNQLGGGM